jgi:hypothetical protein
MDKSLKFKRSFCILSGLSGAAGVVLLIVSFAINNGPPPGATGADLVKFGQQNYAHILWAAWMQAVGPVLIVLFAFALVHLAGATQRLAGWMTFFGATILMTVSLIEVTFYISALNPDPAMMPSISLKLISAVQHLYFIVAAPALFLPLGIVLLSSRILPRLFGYLALLLATAFAGLGVIFLLRLTLPDAVTAVGGVQALWWLAAAIALIVRSGKVPNSVGIPCEGDSHGSNAKLLKEERMASNLTLGQMKTFVRDHFEEFVNRRNAAVIRNNMTPEFYDHDGPGGRPTGADGDEQMMVAMYKSMPDLHLTIEDMLAEGDKVMCRNVWRWTDVASGQRHSSSQGNFVDNCSRVELSNFVSPEQNTVSAAIPLNSDLNPTYLDAVMLCYPPRDFTLN